MRKLVAAIGALLGFGANSKGAPEADFALDYDQMVILDAEDLAETGIREAYDRLKPTLKRYLANPAEITEDVENNLPRYSVSCSGVTHEIYSPTSTNSKGESWGRATYALFNIVNGQLKDSTVKFYAINCGNDLGGMFLTQQQLVAARKSLKKKTDWPYLPMLEHPWYGQYH